jgi:acyl-coenzyme A thioesterase PaaI-like protein
MNTLQGIAVENNRYENLRCLAKSIRELNSALMSFEGPDEIYVALIEEINTFTAELKTFPTRKRTYEKQVLSVGRRKIQEISYGNLQDLSPVSGLSNPVSPYLSMTMAEDNSVEGMVYFPAAYEGGPGLVHGGFIAAVFDELLGKAQAQLEQPGFTGSLNVRYLRPCPINTEYHLEGRVARTEGRKIHTEASMFLDGQRMAAAKAIFVAPG